MTSGGKRRLERIEAALIPTEALALWLQDARADHGSLPALVRSYLGKPEEAWPLFTLARQAESAARARLKRDSARWDSEAVEQAERDAVRDVAVLFFLCTDVNAAFLEEKRALYLLIALLIRAIHDWSRGQRTMQRGEPLGQRLQLAMEELYGWQGTIERLSERYFQGVCPLLPETEEELDWIVTHGELVVEMFNDQLDFEEFTQKTDPTELTLPQPLDLAALKTSAAADAKARVSYLLDLARAEACELTGDRKQGLAFVERHIRKAG